MSFPDPGAVSIVLPHWQRYFLRLIRRIRSEAPTVIGSLQLGSLSLDVATQGTTAIVAGYFGLRFVDVANGASPHVIGILEGHFSGVAVRGGLAYAGKDGGEFVVVDASDFTKPSILGTAHILADLHRVHVDGTIAYVGGGTYGVAVVDVAMSDNPVLLGRIQTLPFYAWIIGFAVEQSFVYTAHSEYGIAIFSVADPASPQFVSSTGNGSVYNVIAENQSAYTFWSDSALPGYRSRLFDVSSPTEPQELPWPLHAYAPIHISNNVLYAWTDEADVATLDVTNPSAPIQMGLFVPSRKGLQSPAATFISDGILYLLYAFPDVISRLVIADLREPAAPEEVSAVDLAGEPGSVTADGGFVYVALYGGVLYAIDARDPVSPTVVDEFMFGALPNGIDVSGNIVALADGTALGLIDASDPSDLRQVASFSSTLNYTFGVTLMADHAYLLEGASFGDTAGMGALQVIDVSNPVRLREVAYSNSRESSEDRRRCQRGIRAGRGCRTLCTWLRCHGLYDYYAQLTDYNEPV